MPNPSLFRGFFKLDRSGDLIIELSKVEPLDKLVTVVFIDRTLPSPIRYGFPEESVMEIPEKYQYKTFLDD